MDRGGLLAAISVAGLVGLTIVVGSQNLRYFDWALLPYAMAAVFSTGAIAYRYAVWLRRPPTWRYWAQGWKLFFRRPIAHTLRLLSSFGDNFAAQRFIGRRSRLRWVTHACLSWGSLLAFGITFPLVFGWIHFETPLHDTTIYRMMVFSLPVADFHVESLLAWVIFNALSVSAILVLIGIGLAFRRRLTEPGLQSLQQFGHDVFPLLLLFAVAATGLGLTVSARWLGGHGFGFISISHMVSVIAMLISLPFGKLFHIFQRSAHLGISLYKRVAATGPQACCSRCLEPFTSRMQAEDLRHVLLGNGEWGMRNAELETGSPGTPHSALRITHWIEICPACRRALWALAQGRLLGR